MDSLFGRPTDVTDTTSKGQVWTMATWAGAFGRKTRIEGVFPVKLQRAQQKKAGQRGGQNHTGRGIQKWNVSRKQ